MRAHSYVNTAVQIITDFKNEVANSETVRVFAQFLKGYFLRHKKHGSKDRKWIGHLCYCYFRLGKFAWDSSIEDRVRVALFLVSVNQNEILEQLKPEWNDMAAASIIAKLEIVEKSFPQFNSNSLVKELFPWQGELTTGVDPAKFSLSFLTQPNLFVRLRPGFEEIVIRKIEDAGLEFTLVNSDCIALSNSSKLERIVDVDREVVIQDINSQQTLHFLPPLIKAKGALKVWDCCAASGGKSLLCYDLLPDIDLTVTDIRQSILSNLKNRFAKAGIKTFKSFVVDLAAIPGTIGERKFMESFDVIICDAPCTGSGTWSRSPEQLYFFSDKMIPRYAALQKQILSNVIPLLKTGGLLVYITCSVFAAENEGAVDFIKDNFGMKLLTIELLQGYNKRADTLFTTCFMKS